MASHGCDKGEKRRHLNLLNQGNKKYGIFFKSLQRAKNVVPNSPGLVDFAIGLVNSVFSSFLEEFEY